MSEVTLSIAFLAGFFTFLSPCIWPILPGFLTFLAGTSIQDTSRGARVRNLISASLFVLGAALVFTLLSVIIRIFFGSMSETFARFFQVLGGLVVLFFALIILGIIHLPALEQERKFQPRTRYQYLSAFLFGIAFATGWSPCIGPILGSIMTLAATRPGEAVSLMLAYTLGLGFPFILSGFFLHETLSLIKRSKRIVRVVTILSGILLILLALLLITGRIDLLAQLSGGSFTTR